MHTVQNIVHGCTHLRYLVHGELYSNSIGVFANKFEVLVFAIPISYMRISYSYCIEHYLIV